jgi:hypothetical protein
MIAAMADLGIKGGKAGVQLRMAIVRLLQPTSKAAAILKDDYNIAVEDLQTMLSEGRIIDVLKLLKERNIDVSDSLELFGVRQSTVIKLIRDGIPIVEKMQKKISNAGGAADLMARRQLNTLNGALKFVNAAFQKIVISMTGDSGMIAGLKDAAIYVGEALVEFNKWLKTEEGMRTMAVTVGMIGFQIKMMIKSIEVLYKSVKLVISPIIEQFKLLSEIIETIKDKDLSWKEKLKAIGTIEKKVILTMKDDFLDLSGAIGDVVEETKKFGIDMLKAISIEADKTGRKIRDAFDKPTMAAGEYLGELADNSVNAFGKIGKAVEKGTETVEKYQKEIQTTGKIMQQVGDAIGGTTGKVMSEIGQMAQAVAGGVEGVVSYAVDKIVSLLKRAEERAKYNAQVNEELAQQTSDNIKKIKDLEVSYLERVTLKRINDELENEELSNERREELLMQRFELEKKIALLRLKIEKASALASIKGWGMAAVKARMQTVSLYDELEGMITGETPSFQGGSSFIPQDMNANIHKGERIIPSQINIPNINNAELINAALRGLTLGGGAGNTSNDNRVTHTRSVSFAGANFSFPNAQNPEAIMDYLMDKADEMGGSIF